MTLHYQKAAVLENRPVSGGVWLLRAAWPTPALPGQFFMGRGWGREPLLARPISVHDWAGGELELLDEVRGEGTRLLSGVRAGDEVELTGALGNGFPTGQLRGRVALVAGGIGIAPLWYAARALAAQGCEVRLYCGFRDEPYTLEKFERVCAGVAVATDSGRFGTKGFVTDLFRPEGYSAVLTCGPEPMMEKTARACLAAGVPVYVSRESRMACGIGACLGCTCHTAGGPKSTCKDGPVFRGEDLYGV